MIIEAFLGFVQGLFGFLFGWLPNIPNFPDGMVDGLSAFLSLLPQAIGLVAYLYTPAMFLFVFTLLIAVLAFDLIYGFAMWIWHKVKG